MENKDVLAIDFGTSNTYYCKCSGGQQTPEGVDFEGGKEGLATAILYREGKKSLIGQSALVEYSDTNEKERKGYTLRTNFKPDIASGNEAKRNAQDFLAAVLEEARSQQIDIEPIHREVIFGVPSEAAQDFRKALSEAAKDAGYGDIRLVDEPKGALLSHIHHKDIPASVALKGILVVDFGGGTCDFAFMCRGNVQHSWGDMQLGGRLFDDLFFQWLIDTNPGILLQIEKERSEYFVHSYLCRELKESFSRTMARDRKDRITKTVQQYGKIVDMSWDEFVRRAQSYRPSFTFMQFLGSIGSSVRKFDVSDAGVDLLGWFRNCLKRGICDGMFDKNDIRLVILAGGSSQWPFISDIVCEELYLDKSRLMRSNRPYAVISEGLAILPALQEKFKTTQEKLKSELPDFCNRELKTLVEKCGNSVAENIGSAITQELFDEKLGPQLVWFRNQGGSVTSLKQQVSSITLSFESRLRSLVEEKVSVLVYGLPGAVKELVSSWLKKHGIASPEEDVALNRPDTFEGPQIEIRNIYGEIIDQIGYFTTVVITSLVGMICGGSGMAIIASGPVGWIIGAIIGLVIGILTVRFGVEIAKQMAEDWDIPKWILRMTLTDKKIGEVREKLRIDIASNVNGHLQQMQTALTEQVTAQIKREIDALSEINQF